MKPSIKTLKYIAILTLLAAPAFAADAPASAAKAPAASAQKDAEGNPVLVLKDHKFTPDTLTVPANTQVKIVIDNQDLTAEEFDSDDLGREKVIDGATRGNVLIGPLKPGTYNFVGEYHEDTAKGTVVVK